MPEKGHRIQTRHSDKTQALGAECYALTGRGSSSYMGISTVLFQVLLHVFRHAAQFGLGCEPNAIVP